MNQEEADRRKRTLELSKIKIPYPQLAYVNINQNYASNKGDLLIASIPMPLDSGLWVDYVTHAIFSNCRNTLRFSTVNLLQDMPEYYKYLHGLLKDPKLKPFQEEKAWINDVMMLHNVAITKEEIVKYTLEEIEKEEAICSPSHQMPPIPPPLPLVYQREMCSCCAYPVPSPALPAILKRRAKLKTDRLKVLKEEFSREHIF